MEMKKSRLVGFKYYRVNHSARFVDKNNHINDQRHREFLEPVEAEDEEIQR